jgi:hypothetical protein
MTMKHAMIAAAALASLAVSGAAFAQAQYQEPAIQGNSSIDYGESPRGANLDTTQPSGGYAEDTLQGPTGNLSGAPMGAANMNGPNRNGQPDNPWLQNGDGPAAQGY